VKSPKRNDEKDDDEMISFLGYFDDDEIEDPEEELEYVPDDIPDPEIKFDDSDHIPRYLEIKNFGKYILDEDDILYYNEEESEEKKEEKTPNGKDDGEFHSVVRDCCKLKAKFAFVVHRFDRPSRSWVEMNKKPILFSKWAPEFGLGTTGALSLRVTIREIGIFPGTIRFDYERSRGPNPASFSDHFDDRASLDVALKDLSLSPVIRPPRNVTPQSPIREKIKAKVSWKPDDCHQTCEIPPQEFIVRWIYASPKQFTLVPPKSSSRGKSGTIVRPGSSLELEDTTPPNEEPDYITPVFVYWSIKSPNTCCGQNNSHEVIQFVKHSWELEDRRPPIRGEDEWNLDISKIQVERHANQQDYDPTFTRDTPRDGSNPHPAVFPGPDPKGNHSINQSDEPGIPRSLFNRLSQGRGKFTWKFHAFLVCKLTPPTNTNYFENGMVEQELVYKIEVKFQGRGKPSKVRGGIVRNSLQRRCKRLKDMLAAKGLTNPYNAPRPHQIEVPR